MRSACCGSAPLQGVGRLHCRTRGVTRAGLSFFPPLDHPTFILLGFRVLLPYRVRARVRAAALMQPRCGGHTEGVAGRTVASGPVAFCGRRIRQYLHGLIVPREDWLGCGRGRRLAGLDATSVASVSSVCRLSFSRLPRLPPYQSPVCRPSVPSLSPVCPHSPVCAMSVPYLPQSVPCLSQVCPQSVPSWSPVCPQSVSVCLQSVPVCLQFVSSLSPVCP